MTRFPPRSNQGKSWLTYRPRLRHWIPHPEGDGARRKGEREEVCVTVTTFKIRKAKSLTTKSTDPPEDRWDQWIPGILQSKVRQLMTLFVTRSRTNASEINGSDSFFDSLQGVDATEAVRVTHHQRQASPRRCFMLLVMTTAMGLESTALP